MVWFKVTTHKSVIQKKELICLFFSIIDCANGLYSWCTVWIALGIALWGHKFTTSNAIRTNNNTKKKHFRNNGKSYRLIIATFILQMHWTEEKKKKQTDSVLCFQCYTCKYFHFLRVRSFSAWMVNGLEYSQLQLRIELKRNRRNVRHMKKNSFDLLMKLIHLFVYALVCSALARKHIHEYSIRNMEIEMKYSSNRL